MSRKIMPKKGIHLICKRISDYESYKGVYFNDEYEVNTKYNEYVLLFKFRHDKDASLKASVCEMLISMLKEKTLYKSDNPIFLTTKGDFGYVYEEILLE
jgi:hypothetical protein